MGSLEIYLRDLLAEASVELPEVSVRRMFGCDAFFAKGSIYAIVWRGRLALKLRDPTRFAELMAMPGATHWDPSRKNQAMSGWVLLGDRLHDDLDALRPWVELAHRAAFSAPPKPPKPRKPSTRPRTKASSGKRLARPRRPS